MKVRARSLLPVVLLAGSVVAAAPTAAAGSEKITLNSRAYEDPQTGYRVKTPKEWVAVPVPPEKGELGLMLYIESEKPEGRRMLVFRLDTETTKGGSSVRPDIADVLEIPAFGIERFEKRTLLEERQVALKKLEAQHRTWDATEDGLIVDTWTFRLEGYDVCLVYTVASYLKFKNRWLSLYEKSAKSFELMERDGSGDGGPGGSYEDLLGWHEADAARTPGWRALPTPSEKFIIKTSSDADKFIKEVIERLEKSRDVFESDFPPPEDFNDVSVVRICDSEEEFHKYGDTSGGVAGWFNPASTELVLYDAQATNRNESYAVMTHEAFHQYCHFLFGKSEAHRWFDEGHGDYYGGMRFKGRRAEVTARMPGGLDRFIRAKDLIRSGQYLSLDEHLNATHREWQSQGPTNTSPYEQSWSIIYMLRQGAEGNVTKKVWKKEYADIVPNYVTTLKEGFARAYDELRAAAGDEAGELELDRSHISPERKEEIWEAAMAASWGQIDLDEFEENWMLYVQKYLKD
jgi:hypothetical protein